MPSPAIDLARYARDHHSSTESEQLRCGGDDIEAAVEPVWTSHPSGSEQVPIWHLVAPSANPAAFERPLVVADSVLSQVNTSSIDPPCVLASDHK